MTRIKICGNTEYDTSRLAIDLGADYLGFIFTPKSKRYIDFLRAADIFSRLKDFPNKVGVFLNQDINEVEKIAAELDLQILQFHGDESSEYCGYFSNKGYKIIKTISIQTELDAIKVKNYATPFFLFDTYIKDEPGGTGKIFDWRGIKKADYVHNKLFLAGGLNPENVSTSIKTVRPFAVDVASGVEIAPGKKSPELLKSFITQAKSA